MHNPYPDVHHANTPPATPVRRFNIGKLIGRLIMATVVGLAFVGYLTPSMRIQWANLMTLCGF